jgi:hypothetical protein
LCSCIAVTLIVCLHLQLADVDYTENSDWFNVQQGSGTEQDMKQNLHKGGMQDLNVYSTAPRGTDGERIAGFTKLPMYSKVPIGARADRSSWKRPATMHICCSTGSATEGMHWCLLSNTSCNATDLLNVLCGAG